MHTLLGIQSANSKQKHKEKCKGHHLFENEGVGKNAHLKAIKNKATTEVMIPPFFSLFFL